MRVRVCVFVCVCCACELFVMCAVRVSLCLMAGESGVHVPFVASLCVCVWSYVLEVSELCFAPDSSCVRVCVCVRVCLVV